MKNLRVLYLFNGSRHGMLEKIERGEVPHTGFWGMTRLHKHGVEATYLELESAFPQWLCRLMRRYVPVYFIHVPFFFNLFAYDVIYTSSAFGTQLLRSLVPFRKPLWVMQDFSIMGILGQEKTFKQKVFSLLVRRSAGIVVVGKKEEELLKKRFPSMADRIRYIPFGTDLSFFAPQDVPQEGYVLAVGFDPDRDWKTLARAAQGIAAKIVLATRPTRVEGLVLPDNVELKTFTPIELVRAYARASLVVVPLDTSKGINDAMGCSTVFEGMAMGKAVVATRTHTLETYLDGTTGVLVPEGDPVALREAIQGLLEDPERRRAVGRAARAYALEHLDDDKLAGKLAKFFKELLTVKI